MKNSRIFWRKLLLLFTLTKCRHLITINVQWFFSVYDHFNIISYFVNSWVDDNPGLRWMNHVYMVILERSKHLSNQWVWPKFEDDTLLKQKSVLYRFTFAMMGRMDKIRNAANAQYLLYKELNSTLSDFKYEEKFKLDWNLYKNETLSDVDKEKFKLWVVAILRRRWKCTCNMLYFCRTLVSYELENIYPIFLTDLSGPRGILYLARIYCAVRSFSSSEFT